MISETSRYHDVGRAEIAGPDGRALLYLLRRFLPRAVDAPLFAEHTVGEDERLDTIAARYLGDPEQFWRICDANDTLRPWDLTATLGRRLRIPLFEGG